ncbi:MAG: helix-turn-helix domain-containing protein, partial [Sphingobacterium sp.]
QSIHGNPDKKVDHQNGARLRMGKYAILGPIKKAFSYTVPPGAELFTLNFRQDAFFRFFGQPPAASDVPLNPDLLTGQGCFGEWWQTLAQMQGLQDRVDYLLNCCRPYIGEQDHRIAQAIQLDQQLGDVSVDPIKTMAATARQSIRNMQLQFQTQLGYSAKAYLRNQRFIQAILLIQTLLDKGEKLDWFTVIETCHYYDQSQLIKDFKYFMDLTPTKYVQFQEAICFAPGNIR